MIPRAMLSGTRAATFVLVAVALAACGGSGGDGTAAVDGPGKTVASTDLPIHSIEAPTAEGAVREYYEGDLAREGNVERGDIPRETRGLLTTTQVGASSPRSYELSEYRIELDLVYKLLGTTTSAGTLTIGDERVGNEVHRVYRLDGGTSPGRARYFTKLYDTLYAPKDPADPAITVNHGSSMEYAATAARGRVEIAQGLSSTNYIQWRVLLRVGDELVVRLDPLEGAVWSLKSETTGTQLRDSGSREEGSFQLFSFKAIEPGETEIEFRNVDVKDPKIEYCCPYKARIQIK